MHFRTKDLMITVLPRADSSSTDSDKVCLWHTRICAAPSFCLNRTCLIGATLGAADCPATFLNPCPHASFELTVITICPHLTFTTQMTCPHATFTTQCVPASHEPFILNDREDLAVLRVELQETLKQLDKLEKTMPSGIRTADDKKRLLEGLKEVQDQVKNTSIDK